MKPAKDLTGLPSGVYNVSYPGVMSFMPMYLEFDGTNWIDDDHKIVTDLSFWVFGKEPDGFNHR